MQRLRLSGSEKINLISNLSTMLGAGIPILEVIDSLLEDAKGNTKKVLEVMREDLGAGNHLYVSLGKFPLSFNRVTVNLVKAAEEAGTLEATLLDLKKTTQSEIEFSDRVKSALFYPMMVLVVFAAVLLLMLVVVIPRISKVFLRLKVPLPLPTKILITISNWLLNYALFFWGSIAAVALLLWLLYHFQRERLLRALFVLPLISSLIRKIDVTRFARSLHLLLSSGVPVGAAFDLAQDVVMQAQVKSVIQKAQEQALGGHKFSEGLKQGKGVMPGIVVKLIEVGEKTGTLDKAMEDVATLMDYEVSKTLRQLTAMLEPIMLVLVGVAVGGMMLAIIAPIYGLIGQVGGS